MDRRCDRCTHWKSPWDEFDDLVADPNLPPWGTCGLIGLLDSTYAESDGQYGVRPESDVKAFTRDGSEYRADLHTRADFGCSEWSGDAPSSGLVTGSEAEPAGADDAPA